MSGFAETDRLAKVHLVEGNAPPRTPEMQQELDVALYDLAEENRFRPAEGGTGPFTLTIAREERALTLSATDPEGAPVASIALPLGALRETVADYAAVCARYVGAVRHLPPAEIEAIDQDRKAIHDEGAEALTRRLAPAAEIDHATARRLFVLVAALCPPR